MHSFLMLQHMQYVVIAVLYGRNKINRGKTRN